MATSNDVTQERAGQRMQDFFFARELAEVYLLLDHLSGRSDKHIWVEPQLHHRPQPPAT